MPPRWFRKNETVMGIIGKTHGVKIAASPNPNAVSANAARPCWEGVGAVAGGLIATATSEGPPGFTSIYPAGTLNSSMAGANAAAVSLNAAVLVLGFRHCLSSQARY